MSDTKADAERERDLAIVRAEREYAARNEDADKYVAMHREAGTITPRHEDNQERKHIVAEQKRGEQIAAAWEAWAAYWAGRLAAHDQKFET